MDRSSSPQNRILQIERTRWQRSGLVIAVLLFVTLQIWLGLQQAVPVAHGQSIDADVLNRSLGMNGTGSYGPAGPMPSLPALRETRTATPTATRTAARAFSPTPTTVNTETATPTPTSITSSTPAVTETTGATETASPSATPTDEVTWTPIATAIVTGSPTPSPTWTETITDTVTPTPTSTATPAALVVDFQRVLEGKGVTSHAISPNTLVQVQVGIRVTAPLTTTVLTDYVPDGWIVADAGSKARVKKNGDSNQVTWTLANITAGTFVTCTYTVTSPQAGTPAPEYSFQSSLSSNGQVYFSEPWLVMLQHPLTVNHYRIGWDAPVDQPQYAAAVDEAPKNVQRYEPFRVRFQVLNTQPVDVHWQPQLEWANQADGTFQPVVVGVPKTRDPFYVRTVTDAADGDRIRTAKFGIPSSGYSLEDGYLFTTRNPGSEITLTANSITEIEFSVRATSDAAFPRAYDWRLTDAGLGLGDPGAQIVMDKEPPVQLSEPQYSGIDPNAAPPPSIKPRNPSGSENPHGSYTISDSPCAECHEMHTAKNANALDQPEAQSNVCFACHNGSSAFNIKGQYNSSIPANDPGTSSYYSHPATTASTHTAAENDEFRGTSNRHSECSDCHNPHQGDNSLATPTANGYTVSGALKGISGVEVITGTRTLAWDSSVTYEYELCYKCHSSYTTLPSYNPPSYKETDKSAEFNPANPSFHPVESAGKNNSSYMANSLSGTSPFKLWNFTPTSVIRCVNCHGDPALADPASPPPANALLSPHTSANRAILMSPYRDRQLKSSAEGYSASDFALCYQCHSEAPFLSAFGAYRTDTNFRLHGFHLNRIAGIGTPGTDINSPGAGNGNAICSECHFNVHGDTTNVYGNPSGQHLVQFAPDVIAIGDAPLYDPVYQSCTLICHGVDHDGYSY